MRTLFIITFSLFLNQSVIAQDNIDLMKLAKAEDTLIGFSMARGNSKVVSKLTKLLHNNNYAEIKKLLLSNNSAEKFLAAVTCNKLLSREKIILTYDEKEQIKKIYNSKEIVYAIYGCTYTTAKPIRDFVYNKKNKLIMTKIEGWLNDCLK